jgi:hypothetical protein
MVVGEGVREEEGRGVGRGVNLSIVVMIVVGGWFLSLGVDVRIGYMVVSAEMWI